MRMHLFAAAVLAAILMSLIGCEGGEEPPSERLTVIGPAGGTAESFDRRARVQIPAGAVEGPLWITIEGTEVVPDAEAILTGSAYSFGPADAELLVPATITIRYDVAQVPEGAAEGQLRLAQVIGGGWQAVAGSVVDPVANSVGAPTTTFGIFAITVAE